MAAIPPDAQLCTVKHSLKSSPDHVPILAYHVCLVHDSPLKLLDVHKWAAEDPCLQVPPQEEVERSEIW